MMATNEVSDETTPGAAEPSQGAGEVRARMMSISRNEATPSKGACDVRIASNSRVRRSVRRLKTLIMAGFAIAAMMFAAPIAIAANNADPGKIPMFAGVTLKLYSASGTAVPASCNAKQDLIVVSDQSGTGTTCTATGGSVYTSGGTQVCIMRCNDAGNGWQVANTTGTTPSGCPITLTDGHQITAGAACFTGSFPAETNPVDPSLAPYNADPTGATDACTPFKNALATGRDIYVSKPGTYNFNSFCTASFAMLEITGTAGRNFQCAPGVTLVKNVATTTFDSYLLYEAGSNGAQLTGGSIAGCHFQGANTNNIGNGNQGDNVIGLDDVSNIIVEDISCKWEYGDGCIHLSDPGADSNGQHGVTNGSISNTITYSDFGPDPLQGVAFISGHNNSLNHSHFYDSGIDFEGNGAAWYLSNNTEDSNAVEWVKGNAAPYTPSYQAGCSTDVNNKLICGVINVGDGSGANYSNSTLSNNYVTGHADSTGTDVGISNYSHTGFVYTGNVCTNGCACLSAGTAGSPANCNNR